MDFFIQHLDAIVVAVILLAGGGIFLWKFTQLPKEKRYEQIKAWLLQAVLLAEKKFGGKTGKLKLSYVYDLFVKTFPWLAKVIPFEIFSQFVDQVLEEAKELLTKNEAIAAYVIDVTE